VSYFRIVSIKVAARVQTGAREIAQFFLAISLVLLISSGLMWFANLKPKGEEDAFVQLDMRKADTYVIHQQVAGIYEKNQQYPPVRFLDDCQTDITSIQFSEEKLNIAQQELDKLGKKLSEISEQARNVELGNYVDFTSSAAYQTKIALQEQFYRQSITLQILQQVSSLCNMPNIDEKKVKAVELEEKIKNSREYQNLDPQWEKNLLAWLKNTQNSSESSQLTVEEKRKEYEALFTLNQKSSQLYMLQQTEKSSLEALQKLEEWQKNVQKNSQFEGVDVISLAS